VRFSAHHEASVAITTMVAGSASRCAPPRFGVLTPPKNTVDMNGASPNAMSQTASPAMI